MPPEPAKPMKVLVVDDDPVQRQMASVFLSMGGHRAVAAEGGRAALALLDRETFDIALLDHDMPDMTGLELMMAIRQRQLLGRMPVMFVTSRDDMAVIDRAFELGASGFVMKPVNWQLMQHEIRFVLRAAENERTARAARDAALTLAATKEQLLGIVRHELKTPMNAVIGFGRIVRDGLPEGTPLRGSADEMVDAADRMNRRLADMLTCLDLTSGRLAATVAEEQPAWIIDDHLPRWRRLASASGAEVRVVDEAPELRVRIDARHLTEILDRIIDNAITHGHARTLTIRLSRVDAASAVIAVEDDGAGIAPERLAACLEAFSQSDMSVTRPGEGLGLGLYIVQGLAVLNACAFQLLSNGSGQGVSARLVMKAA